MVGLGKKKGMGTGLFGGGKAEKEVNRLQKEVENMLEIDKHQIELDEQIERDLQEIHQIIERDGGAINAIAETENLVDIGRNLERHNIERSISELKRDFDQLNKDIQDAISDIEEKRKELRQEVQLEDKEEGEFGELSEWAQTLDKAVTKLGKAEKQGKL